MPEQALQINNNVRSYMVTVITGVSLQNKTDVVLLDNKSSLDYYRLIFLLV